MPEPEETTEKKDKKSEPKAVPAATILPKPMTRPELEALRRTVVWAVRRNPADTNVVAESLKEVAKLDVQIVTLANTPLSQTLGTVEIKALLDHVVTV